MLLGVLWWVGAVGGEWDEWKGRGEDMIWSSTRPRDRLVTSHTGPHGDVAFWGWFHKHESKQGLWPPSVATRLCPRVVPPYIK